MRNPVTRYAAWLGVRADSTVPTRWEWPVTAGLRRWWGEKTAGEREDLGLAVVFFYVSLWPLAVFVNSLTDDVYGRPNQHHLSLWHAGPTALFWSVVGPPAPFALAALYGIARYWLPQLVPRRVPR
jgi:hypothetical protein